MDTVRDFLGNEITPGATVVYATRGGVTLRKGTVISVSPRLLVRVELDEKSRRVWIRDSRRVVVVQ